MTSRLRCVTLNVLGPANPDWERRSLIIKDVLDRLRADVVALQEVRAADVEQLLGPGYQVTPFSSASEDGTGGVLATRAPHDVLEEIDQRTAEHGQDLPWCATLIVALDSPIGRLVVAHHKPNWPFPLEVEREQQARRAALAVEQHAGDGPAVVLGDFDATPDSGSMSFWRGRRSLDGVSVCFQDAWETRPTRRSRLHVQRREPARPGRRGRDRGIPPYRLRAGASRPARSAAAGAAL